MRDAKTEETARSAAARAARRRASGAAIVAAAARLPAIAVAVAVAVAGCARAEPPAPPGAASAAPLATIGGGAPERAPDVTATGPNAPSPPIAPGADGATRAGETARGVNGGEPAPAGTDADGAPAVDPGTLPQTHDAPPPSSAAFDRRMRAFWDAIVRDDPPRALPAFFPVTAYAQVKAIADPRTDWNRRLVAAFTRDIHAAHADLVRIAAANGVTIDAARLVRVDVPDARARWMKPGDEYNRIGYFRVLGARLVFDLLGPSGPTTDAGAPLALLPGATDVTGATQELPVTSMISWRGEWYVVHFRGFR